MPHARRSAAALRRLGACLVVLALVVGALLVLQPWVTCPDDTASAACPVPLGELPLRTVLTVGAAAAAVVGLALLARPSRRD